MPKDDHYLALCKEVKADFLVTGDKDLLSIPPETLKKNGIPCRILTPQEFAEVEEGEEVNRFVRHHCLSSVE